MRSPLDAKVVLRYPRRLFAGKDTQYEQVRDLLLSSRFTVVLTGAGVSTSSGIPDFRSPGNGLWEYSDPFEVASIWGFREQPQRFYAWVRPLAIRLQNARPNEAHWGFARLERLGLLQTILTQNIDDLHQQAGSQRVLQLHGNTRGGSCLSCSEKVDGRELWQRVLANGEAPSCSRCGGVLKPDVVLLGEELPAAVLAEAQQAALQCDLMMVAGSSLEVMPAADLPHLAKRRGAKVVIVNRGWTTADPVADVVIHEELAIAIPRIVEMCVRRNLVT